MPNTVIQLKKSATVSAKPTDLANGELAINFADGKLFYKNTAGYIAEISGVQASSFGTIDANGTLVVSDTSGDVLTLLPGNNITIVGDAINDRVTIGLSNDVTVPGVLYMQAVGGDEGGQIELANAITNSTVAGNVVIDIYQNRLRFYEKGSPNKGAFIDLSIAGSGVSSNLLAISSGTTDTVARSTAESAFLKANQVGEAVTTANTNITNLGYVVSTHNNAITTANTNIANINGALTSSNGNITAAFLKANQVGEAVTTANSNIANLNGALSTSNTNITNLSYVVTTHNNAITTANTNIANINGALLTSNGNITAAFLKANQVGEAVTTANSNIANINGALTTSNGNITAAFLKANQVGEAVTTANNNIANLAYVVTTHNGAFTTANTNITAAFLKANQVGEAVTTANGNITAAFAKANTALANTSGVSFNGNLNFPTGNVGIGTSSPLYRLEVAGSFAAQTKSFVINHPTKKGMKLRYGSLEGPENGVYIRGRLTDENYIDLPDYWSKLVDVDSITVSLTPIGKTKMPSVGKITKKRIQVLGDDIDCFYHIFAERKDVEKLIVEI